jgi:hypothetical protein
MKKTIQSYKSQLTGTDIRYNFFNFSNVALDLKAHFDAGEFFIERRDQTSFDLFSKEMGYKLPQDICEYINAYWHPGIFGYYKTSECIVLFPVVRYTNDTPNSILMQKDGLIPSAKKWEKLYGGDITRYLPIGYLSYSEMNVLYEVNSGKIFLEDLDNEGSPENNPIANSFKELIGNLKVFPASQRSDDI